MACLKISTLDDCTLKTLAPFDPAFTKPAPFTSSEDDFLATLADGLDTLLSTLSVTQLGTCAAKLKEREVNLSVPNVKLC